MIAEILVWTIVAGEILLPVALVFWAGRRFERWSQERRVSAGARPFPDSQPVEGPGFPHSRRRR